MPLEPLRETAEALETIGEFVDWDLVADLRRTAARVAGVVPQCVGMSVSLYREGLTFTLVATHEEIAGLDGVQYAVGGPCVDAVMEDRLVDTSGEDGLFSEDRWAAFARAGAAAGVLSTLSMPLESAGRVTGGVNLYASTPDAFVGQQDALSVIVGAWAPGAVLNADLSFASRLEAAQAPTRLQDQALTDQAIGYLSAAGGVDTREAQAILEDAAARAGTSQAVVAKALLGLHEAQIGRG
ncbi:ANTAR domain-containing protein [Knoellia sp. Soil729]|uniref:ANTAR domain-containing protein n=1 Tax=Knoellia sp. Soil729 TaxID=1736394 RepID=UPI0006FF36CE|nr:ANTAR domain-containing protein [Knoellia sp. Soil729]KRE43990.1 hypothetical protein ASG74_03960 [Knoellia sp. Soil729]